MAVPIAELFVSVGADVSAAISNLTSLGTRLESTALAFQNAAPAALVFEAAAAGIGAGLLSSVKVAADFEHQMSGVKAVMTPTEVNQFGDALSQLAITLGRDTVFTSREAAAGIEELIKAGIPAEAVLGGAGAAALNLAAATGISVPQAATVAAQTMNAFGKSASELTNVVDLLAGTANATAADMSDLQFGLQVVSATAGTMGLSFADTAEAIGLFVSAGETGATAGTGLRQMLLELIPTTKPAREEMLKLGLTTKEGGNAFFDAQGHVKSLADIAGTLQRALAGMSDQQRIAALNTLFTRDAINSASILARTGSDSVRALADSIGQISAAESAATRLGNLQGALQNLGGSVETVQIIIGNLFLPRLTEMANTVRGVVDRFSALDPSMQAALVTFSGISAVVAGALGGMVLLSPAIVAIGSSFGALLSVLPRVALLFAPIGIAAALLVAAWQSNLGNIQGIVANAFDRLPSIMDNVSAVFERAGVFWENSIVPTVERIGSAVGTELGTAFATIQGQLEPLGPILNNFGLVAQKAIAGDLGGAFDTFRAIVGTLAPPLGGLLGIFQGVGSFVATQVVPGMADLADRIMPILAGVGAALGEAWDAKLSPALATVGGWLASLLPFFAQLGIDALPLVRAASEDLASFWETKMQPAFQKVGDFIDQSLLKSLADLGNGLSSLTGEKVTAVGEVFGGNLLNSLSSFGNQLQPLIPVFQSVGGFFASVGDVFAAFAELRSRGQQGAAVEDPLTASLQRLVDFVAANADLGNNMLILFGPMGQALEGIARQGASAAGFFTAMSDALRAFNDAVRSIPELPDWLQRAISAGSPLNAALAAGNQIGANAAAGLGSPAAGGGAAGGGDVHFNAPINISTPVDLDNFLERVAGAVRSAAGRVNAPPDNSGFPALQTP